MTKLLLNSIGITVLLFVLSTSIQAQDVVAEEDIAEESSFSFSGSVDAYFRSNSEAPGTSFANLSGFSLGMINLVAGYEGDKVGFVGDMVLGPRGEDATFLSPELRPGGSSNIVNQLYMYYNVSENVKFTLGNFNTFLGYEVISPTGNFNYSTSYMFSYGPFSHTGLKVDIGLGNGLSLMGGVFNPTDATEYNPTDDYVFGAQLGYEFSSGGAWLNTLFDADFFQIDLTAGADISDNVYVGVNATSASDNFWGAAGYLQIATSDALKLGARVEYFSDNGIEVIGTDESVLDLTLSASYAVGSLTIIPEFRLDSASIDVFDDGGSSSLTSFVLATVYGF